MIDFILVALSAVLFAFCILFIVSFVTLSVITAIIHFTGVIYRCLFIAKPHVYQEQTA